MTGPARQSGAAGWAGAVTRLAAMAIVAAPLALAEHASGQVVEEFVAGSWHGFSLHEGGRFEACLVVTAELADPRLFFYQRNFGVSVAVQDDRWRLAPLDTRVAALHIDDRWSFRVPAIVAAETSWTMPLDRDPAAIDALRRGRMLDVAIDGRRHRFSLRGSSAALAELDACYNRNAPAMVENARPAEAAPQVRSPDTTAPANPFAPADVAPDTPLPESSNPFAPPEPDAGNPPAHLAAATPPPIVPDTDAPSRPRPGIDGLQRIVPYLPFDAFEVMVQTFLPGDPSAEATPDDVLSDYQFEGGSGNGRYRGLYLEAALRGATVEDLLDYLMWIDEQACDGIPGHSGPRIERIGGTTVARGEIKCQASGRLPYRSIIISGQTAAARIFIIDGTAAAADAAAAVFRTLTGLAREG